MNLTRNSRVRSSGLEIARAGYAKRYAITKMDDKFTKSNFLRVGKEVLDFQMRNLYPVQLQGEQNRINLILLNHDRNFSTFLTIMDLVKHERVADIYTLSRSMFESIISMGLLAKSIVADDLNRYQEYQFTEIHKTYIHLVRLGLQQLSGVNPSDANLVKQRSQEYINKYGRNLSTWTGYSLEDNVKLLDKNIPPTWGRKGDVDENSDFTWLANGTDRSEVTYERDRC